MAWDTAAEMASEANVAAAEAWEALDAALDAAAKRDR